MGRVQGTTRRNKNTKNEKSKSNEESVMGRDGKRDDDGYEQYRKRSRNDGGEW